MPENINRTPIQNAWIAFVAGAKVLLVPRADDRGLDQYLQYRDIVLGLVQSEEFLASLNAGWPPNVLPTEIQSIENALILELEAFPRAVETVKSAEKPAEQEGWWSILLGRASTVSGSVDELMENLPWYAKCSIKLFRELVDLWRGKD